MKLISLFAALGAASSLLPRQGQSITYGNGTALSADDYQYASSLLDRIDASISPEERAKTTNAVVIFFCKVQSSTSCDWESGVCTGGQGSMSMLVNYVEYCPGGRKIFENTASACHFISEADYGATDFESDDGKLIANMDYVPPHTEGKAEGMNIKFPGMDNYIPLHGAKASWGHIAADDKSCRQHACLDDSHSASGGIWQNVGIKKNKHLC